MFHIKVRTNRLDSHSREPAVVRKGEASTLAGLRMAARRLVAELSSEYMQAEVDTVVETFTEKVLSKETGRYTAAIADCIIELRKE